MVDTLVHYYIGPKMVLETLELYISSVRPLSIRPVVPHHRCRCSLSVRLSRRPFRGRRLSSVRPSPSVPSLSSVVVVHPLSVRPVVRLSITRIIVR